MATWQSPLASEFDGDPDVAQGEEIYFNEHWTDTSPYALTCFSCHSNSPDDTLAVDADEYNRPRTRSGTRAYAARGRVARSGTWRSPTSSAPSAARSA
jgi:hypothetical protein